MMVYYNPHINTLNNQGFFIAHLNFHGFSFASLCSMIVGGISERAANSSI